MAAGFSQRDGFTGAWGVAREQSTGKDTQSGHWEIAGVPVLFDWGYFPKTVPSFPKELTDKLQELTGVPGWLGNCHASGTTIIDELGDEHVATGKPILYTSADSVLQIAAHEEHFGLERLYEVCEAAYELVKPYNIGRVIARPFTGRERQVQAHQQPPRLRRAAGRADPARPRQGRGRRGHRPRQDQRHLRGPGRDPADQGRRQHGAVRPPAGSGR
jgi:phosphopentomutase